jgi:hypothetical protein
MVHNRPCGSEARDTDLPTLSLAMHHMNALARVCEGCCIYQVIKGIGSDRPLHRQKELCFQFCSFVLRLVIEMGCWPSGEL